MDGSENDLDGLLERLSLGGERRPISPSHEPPWFFSSAPSRHVNYRGLEPAPMQEWKPEPLPSDEEIRKISEEAKKQFDLKDIELEINIQIKSESHKKFRKSIKEYQKKKKGQTLARSSISKEKNKRKTAREDKRDLKKHIQEAVALGIDPHISAMEILMGNMKV